MLLNLPRNHAKRFNVFTYKHNKILRSQVILPYIIVNCLHMELYILQAGQQMKDKAQGACDAVKDKVGANK